jgi:hypothetical protein
MPRIDNQFQPVYNAKLKLTPFSVVPTSGRLCRFNPVLPIALLDEARSATQKAG